MKKVVALLFVLLCTFALVGNVPSASAHEANHTVPYSCYQQSCEGLNPPCPSGDSLINEKTIYEQDGTAIGHLDLFHSDNVQCATWNVGLKDIVSFAFDVNRTKTIEAGDDNSIEEQCCNLIYPALIQSGQYFSSRMVADNSQCYHGYSQVTDPDTGVLLTTNTNTYCY